MTRASVAMVAIAFVCACGDDDGTGATGANGGASQGGGGSGSGGTPLGGSDAGGGGGVSQGGGGAAEGGGGSTGEGGTGGGPDCPDIQCADDCPTGNWIGVDGCPTCACDPPDVQMIINGNERDKTFVAFSVDADRFIGGIDRWVFDFQWVYDDPQTSDDEEHVDVQVRVQDLPEYTITDQNVTWFEPQDAGAPLEVMGGTYTLFGIVTTSAELIPVSGFLSIRRVGDTFEGGVYLDFDPAQVSPGPVHVSAPFSVAVP